MEIVEFLFAKFQVMEKRPCSLPPCFQSFTVILPPGIGLRNSQSALEVKPLGSANQCVQADRSSWWERYCTECSVIEVEPSDGTAVHEVCVLIVVMKYASCCVVDHGVSPPHGFVEPDFVF